MGRAPCCDKANVKKGPWSPEEDSKLKDYIEKNGTGGNWISLPQKAGLRRCGKSCRLRWLNYLRPNIKHGEFSDEEDRIICTLYANIGSRWSIIAAQLPGRTDNDIKNYWNTKLKKKLMNLLPQSHHNTILPYQQISSPLPSHSTSFYNQPNTSFITNIEPISLPSPISNPFYHNQESLLNGFSTNTSMQYNSIGESVVMFGSEGSCCTSSDGSLGKQEEIMGFQNFMQSSHNHNKLIHGSDGRGEYLVDVNHHWENEKVNLCFGKEITTGLDYDLEYIKQLISCNNGNYLSIDENKMKEEKSMYYYY
ncbi:transcription factor RAX2-like protein [Trifolium pratense]|uniref:Uncharacterized protein n=2 Tax=Trifolium pratense TaxID=57577 RepID=A0ACB0KWP7_TRIPR|nr:transcription factor RAX2-like [Trifolium pratense]PNX92916.1 transcription factor RAX2-like protein [Trifolium pratense]CAJ2660762.1 unnamed protein product [Trifolium pratense]